MKRMNRTLFVRLISRLLFLTFAVWVVSHNSAGEAQAQTVLPMAVEKIVSRQLAPGPVDDLAVSRIEGGILNLDNALVDDLRKNRFSLTLTDSEPKSGQQKENKTESAAVDVTTQDPMYRLPGDERWRKSQQFNWDGAMKQSAIFLGIQHAFRLATEEGTRADLKGPFFKDYLKALKSLRGWDDGDPFIVNYIGHPMMGSVAGFIQVHNDPRGINEEVSLKKSYWVSRLKATAWSFAYSTQFELGLISEASLGNIGIRPYGNRKHPMAYVDIVITPVVGTGWLVGEDLLDKHFIRRFEDQMPDRVTYALFRSFLNPTRSFANILRGKKPWFRDNRP